MPMTDAIVSGNGDPVVAAVSSPGDGRHYSLRLDVAGQTPRSLTAIGDLRKLPEDNITWYNTIDAVDGPRTRRSRRATSFSRCRRSFVVGRHRSCV